MRKRDLRRERAIARFEKELRDMGTIYYSRSSSTWAVGKKAALERLIQNTKKNMGRG